MRPQINRLPADKAGSFAGTAIDRSRPLRFRLDGRLISGFAGDTVLSAALASGIDSLGRYDDSPLGLTPSASPAISLAARAGKPHHALPMARTPAMDGADFVTLGGSRVNPLARLFLPGRTLGLALDGAQALDRPWRALAGTLQPGADLVVIGGGVAGMEAALAAARAGLATILVEAGPQLGGHSGLFGTQEGEAAPEADIGALRAAIAASDAIEVLTHGHAYALRPGLVRIHHIDTSNGTPTASVLDLATRYIILATGSRERLPIFSGNRLPGISSTLDAYQLACRYGIWPGQSALVATASNVAYRLAMLASDAGIAIDRVLDSRPSPSSRFIAFSRAYGMVQVPNSAPERAGIAKAGGRLSIHHGQAGSEPITTERLLVCGGWQPDLTLWHVAGGASRWHRAHHRLEAVGEMDNIALAGSAAGYFTRRGCKDSGRDAVAALLHHKRIPVDDPLIDPLYESPDAPLIVAEPAEDAPPAFLDSGRGFLQRPAPRRRSWMARFRRDGPPNGLTALSEAPQALAIGDVAAGVDLGLIPADAAGIVAQERVALVPLTLPAGPAGLPPADDIVALEEVPAYLEGRFGDDALWVKLVPAQSRRLSSGALIYRNSDSTQPLYAVGVVLRPSGEAAMALIAAETVRAGLPVIVRDQGRAIAAQIDYETP
ncbi:FAD-dependent oxidoreductase [Devosia sp. YIM 151766]|uniref:FAD-dependent oxidoreductase n=1 Tax=Devosia sp. YIM 151766 TaxID=3017325 RepID=UPI00255CB290|nr:FAD-dependent oxidoreductase [Devosia sp. YIM 151766]WIY53685.1 FAD-dependent oxidoreductase [Devosia sp. YIM 151766]